MISELKCLYISELLFSWKVRNKNKKSPRRLWMKRSLQKERKDRNRYCVLYLARNFLKTDFGLTIDAARSRWAKRHTVCTDKILWRNHYYGLNYWLKKEDRWGLNHTVRYLPLPSLHFLPPTPCFSGSGRPIIGWGAARFG